MAGGKEERSSLGKCGRKARNLWQVRTLIVNT